MHISVIKPARGLTDILQRYIAEYVSSKRKSQTSITRLANGFNTMDLVHVEYA